MTDEIIAPLMASTDNSEESEESNSSKNINNDDELDTNLIDNNNIRENFDIYNYNIIRNNFHLNNFAKKRLIFLSYAIQVLIYYILLQIYYDKIDYIKKNYNKLYALSIIFTIIILFWNSNFSYLRELNIFFAIILAIISSISMYFFLYFFTVFLTPNVLNSIMFITIPMFLNLSIIHFYYSSQENVEGKIIFFSTTIVIYLFSHILNLIKMINLGIAIYDFCVVFCLFIIVFINIDMLFKDFNVRLKHYPIIHLSLFIDVCILNFILYIFYDSGEKKGENKNKKVNL